METRDLTFEVSRRYIRDQLPVLGEVLTNKLLGYLRARDVSSLSQASSHFDMHSHDVNVIRSLLQIEAFFKKNASFADDEYCTAAAKSSFFANEASCRRTNRRLDWYYIQRDRLDPDLNEYLSKMEKFVEKTLGPFDRFLEEIPLLTRVTPGATSTDSRRRSAPHRKMKLRYRCPAAGAKYLRSLAKFFGYPEPRVITSAVNRVEVVPKSWKTHRTIACEPDGALPFQLAFDSYCKRRLRRANVDLRFQDRNQQLAKLGSIRDNLATIDLSAASDTVAYNTVAWLFPQQWFQYLCAFRSTHFKGAFGYGKYSKFSSMGNGSTFVIETLVFAAACHAVGSRGYSVYGDDIVIEQEFAPALLRVLKFLGFKVNPDKSFTHGPFRESCGSYWYRGVDVKPFFIRENARLKPELCHIVNGLAAVATIGGQLWSYLIDIVKSERLPLVPDNLNTMSGIHIEPHSSYTEKLVRGFLRKKGDQIPAYRSYVTKSGVGRYVGTSQTLALWYLRKYQRRSAEEIDLEPLICSWETLLTKRYVRKWVCWLVPARQSSAHLIWWSDDLLRSLKS